MRYKIYGDDIFAYEPPFVRSLDITDEMDEYDIINYINKFWKVRHYYDTAKGEGKKPKLIIGSDKDGCLTLFLKTYASLRRLGILLPETHPLFNHYTLWSARFKFDVSRRRNLFTDSPIKYFTDQIQQFVYDNI